MADETVTPESPVAGEPAKSHFAKAVEEAKAGAQALGKEAQQRAEGYKEMLGQKGEEMKGEAHAKGEEAREKAYSYAVEGKAKASQAFAGLGKLVEENAATVDERVGVKYGNYARSAGQTIQDTAARLDEKTLEEIGDEIREFVREKPALAVGIAAATGFALARLFRGR